MKQSCMVNNVRSYLVRWGSCKRYVTAQKRPKTPMGL